MNSALNVSKWYSITSFSFHRWTVTARLASGLTWNAMWYDNVDAKSFPLSQDIDGDGVHWCQTKGCRKKYETATIGRAWLRKLTTIVFNTRTTRPDIKQISPRAEVMREG
jgi:hypothetical protein